MEYTIKKDQLHSVKQTDATTVKGKNETRVKRNDKKVKCDMKLTATSNEN